MWLIVGLGNPGPKYARTRHNLGFFVIDELARRHLSGGFRSKFGGEVASGMIASVGKVQLLKPMEYMNLSGYAVQRASHFFDVEPESIVIVHDEIDIEFGRLKLKAGGGHGGHNGLRSVIQELGSRDFLRVRCGIGKPGRPTDGEARAAGASDAGRAAVRDRRVAGYLLSEFPRAQDEAIDELVRRAADATEALLANGLQAAMNEFHGQEVGAASG